MINNIWYDENPITYSINGKCFCKGDFFREQWEIIFEIFTDEVLSNIRKSNRHYPEVECNEKLNLSLSGIACVRRLNKITIFFTNDKSFPWANKTIIDMHERPGLKPHVFICEKKHTSGFTCSHSYDNPLFVYQYEILEVIVSQSI